MSDITPERRHTTYLIDADELLALLDALEESREKANRWMAAHEKSEWQGMGYMEERDQLRAENERLRAACYDDWNEPGGSFQACRLCEDYWRHDEPEHHQPTCALAESPDEERS